MKQFEIPEIDLVIVDLYPFEETVATTNDEKSIIEKIDIGGPSMIRAAAKNFSDLLVVASRADYTGITTLLKEQGGSTTLEQRKAYAAKAFSVVAHYDVVIAQYFNPDGQDHFVESYTQPTIMRYGENPHQSGVFFGNLEEIFTQVNGKELSYNNLVDVDAAVQLMGEFSADNAPEKDAAIFAIIKHTNVCGIALRKTVKQAWEDALAGDPESAFGGVLASSGEIDAAYG